MTLTLRLEKLISAHSRAHSMAGSCRLKLLHARQSGDLIAVKALKRQLRFWQRRILRIDGKLSAASSALLEKIILRTIESKRGAV
jgi:hypothetical protein